MDDSELDTVLRLFKVFINGFIDYGEWILMLIPPHLTENVRHVFSTFDSSNMEYRHFPETINYYINPFFRDISSHLFGAAEKITGEIDIYGKKKELTVQQMLMIGVVAHNAVQRFDILLSFSSCGLSPFAYEFSFEDLVKNNSISQLILPRFLFSLPSNSYFGNQHSKQSKSHENSYFYFLKTRTDFRKKFPTYRTGFSI